MKLLIINSEQAQKELQTSIGYESLKETWWVNGRQENGQWFFNNAGTAYSLYENATWYNGDSLGDGNCLATVRFNGEPRTLKGTSCNTIAWPICEF